MRERATDADLRGLADEIRTVLPKWWACTATVLDGAIVVSVPHTKDPAVGPVLRVRRLAPYEADAFLRAYDPQGTRTPAHLLDLFAQVYRKRA